MHTHNFADKAIGGLQSYLDKKMRYKHHTHKRKKKGKTLSLLSGITTVFGSLTKFLTSPKAKPQKTPHKHSIPTTMPDSLDLLDSKKHNNDVRLDDRARAHMKSHGSSDATTSHGRGHARARTRADTVLELYTHHLTPEIALSILVVLFVFYVVFALYARYDV